MRSPLERGYGPRRRAGRAQPRSGRSGHPVTTALRAQCIQRVRRCCARAHRPTPHRRPTTRRRLCTSSPRPPRAPTSVAVPASARDRRERTANVKDTRLWRPGPTRLQERAAARLSRAMSRPKRAITIATLRQRQHAMRHAQVTRHDRVQRLFRAGVQLGAAFAAVTRCRFGIPFSHRARRTPSLIR